MIDPMNLQDIDNKPELFEIGAELTTVKIENEETVCSGRQVIASWDDRFDFWRDTKGGAIRPNGEGYYFMSKKEKIDFLYSANPEHIELRNKAAAKAKQERETKEKEKAEKLAEFNSKLNNLLKEYGASIDPMQLSGDDQGVELGIEISLD